MSGTLRGISGGNAGVWQTVRAMRRLVNDSRTNLDLRQTATSVVFLCPPKDEIAEARAIFDFVQSHIRYTKDIHGVETLSSPEITLAGRVGDCDDQATLLATLFECVGYPTRFVVAGYTSGELEHVFLQVFAGGDWIDCDPTERNPMGWAPPGAVVTHTEKV